MNISKGLQTKNLLDALDADIGNQLISNVLSVIRRTIFRIKLFIDWFPILWNDYDWDNVYLYKIMEKKLERMQVYLRNGVAADRERTAKEIGIAKNCLHRLIEDNYCEKDYAEHFVKLSNSKPKTMSVQESIEFKLIFEREEQLRKQDLELFAKLFVRNSRTWWD